MFSVVSMSVIARIALSNDSDKPHSLLCSRFLRWVGKYSYGTYVLHHLFLPLMLFWFAPVVFETWFGPGIISKLATVGVITACSLALGYVSWHAWEKWFLRLKRHFAYSPRKVPSP